MALALGLAGCGPETDGRGDGAGWGGIPLPGSSGAEEEQTGAAGESGDRGTTGGPSEPGTDDGAPEPPGDGTDGAETGSPPVDPPPAGIEHCEADGRIVFEAEHYTEQTGYSEIARADASGGAVMQVGDAGELHFDAWFASAGRVEVSIRTFVPIGDSENNGLHIDVDGQTITAPADHELAGTHDIFLDKIGWAWEPKWQLDGSVAPPVSFEIEPGVHRFTIRKRLIERPEIDKIVLDFESRASSDLGPAPTGCP